jgi:hypothetical protein
VQQPVLGVRAFIYYPHLTTILSSTIGILYQGLDRPKFLFSYSSTVELLHADGPDWKLQVPIQSSRLCTSLALHQCRGKSQGEISPTHYFHYNHAR